MAEHKISVVIICFLVCVLGTVVTATNSRGAQWRTPEAELNASLQLSDKQPNRIEFTRKGMGELETEKGVRLPFTSFEASDGAKLIAISGEFDSPERAKEQFEIEIAKAAKIIERGVKTNKAGKPVGERARILLTAKAQNHATAAVLWTQGRYFHEITSSSWIDVQALAMKYSD